MNQADLQHLSDERILDAQALLAGSRWGYAYYVAGYAIECALKSCILARMIHTGAIFKDKKFSESCWTHDFSQLVKLAGLDGELNDALASDAALGGAFVKNWSTVRQWNEASRYSTKSELEAKALVEAICQNPGGVMQWIQMYW